LRKSIHAFMFGTPWGRFHASSPVVCPAGAAPGAALQARIRTYLDASTA